MSGPGKALSWDCGEPGPGPGRTLGEAIAAQARLTPDAIAVRQWDQVLRYGDLAAASGWLAGQLRLAGVGPESRVGICARRTVALPVMIAGVLRAGGAYLPLDPGQPPSRLRALLDDSDAEIAVVDQAGRERIAGSGRRLIELPAASEDLLALASGAPAPTVSPAPPAEPGNAAYVMYTSGSTGRPKGIIVSHQAVMAFADTLGGAFGLGGHTRSIGFASLGFDASVIDILVPLTRGGAVQLAGDDDRTDPVRLQRFLEEHRVTWGMIPPALLPLLEPGRLADLTDILTGGEAAGPEQVSRWSAAGGRRFHNLYGLTETAVCVTAAELTGTWERPLPIGYPLPGCLVSVLDNDLNPCPPGVPGELHVAGVQLARCYLRQPAETSARFLPDRGGTRLFRTGDLVVSDADGCLRYLGRSDRQVKVQGQRVEIGEVEAVLRAHPRVRQAVAEAVTGAGGLTEIVAHLTPADAPDVAALRPYVLARLPAYMAPTQVIRSESFQLTASGKVDVAALSERLSERPGERPGEPLSEPRDARPAWHDSPVAASVAAAWAQVFESAEPAPDDDFFACGGHSLTAMRLVSALRTRTGRSITVDDLYQARTMRRLAAQVAAAPEADDVIGVASEPALSAAQRRMWFVEQLEPGLAVHNIVFALRLRGPLDQAALRAAMSALARRHEVLRWRIEPAGGMGEVIACPPGAVPLPVTEFGGRSDPELRELLDAEAVTPFDLAAGPLWRARLIRLGAGDQVLSVAVHHIIFDGWSRGILCRELSRAYRCAASGLPVTFDPLPASFADYVSLLARQRSAAGEQDLEWWRAHLAGVPPVVDLPRDRPRPAMQTFRGASGKAVLGAGAVTRLDRFAAGIGATRNAALLAAFGILVRRLTGQHDLVVGAPFTDRGYAEFEPVIGLFLQILPLRLRIADDRGFADHVRRAQSELSAVLPHAAAPWERVIESAAGPRDLSRNPLIQVLFNPHGFGDPRLDLPGVRSEALDHGLPGALFDLTLYVTDGDEGLALQAVYNPDLYDAPRIEALLASYTALMGDLLDQPGSPVGKASARPAGSRLPGWRDRLPDASAAGLVDAVAAVMARQPASIAVSGEPGSLTYQDVAEISARTARAVLAARVRPGEAVAIYASRHPALSAIMLGVLRTGARWVVMDPAHPPALLKRQAAAAAPRAVIGFAPAGECQMPDDAAFIAAELLTSPVPGEPRVGPGAPERCDQPQGARGYLSLTSGTTGEPRLVVTAERPLAEFLAWYPEAYGLDGHDRFAMLGGLAHDPLLRDLFTPLVLGARLCVPEPECLHDPARLLAWLRDQRVTVAHLTPQLARLLIGAAGSRAQPGQAQPGQAQPGHALPGLRLVALAGDQAMSADLAGLRDLAPAARVLNCYGTTETPQVQAVHEPGPALAGQGDSGLSHPVPAGSGVAGAALVVLGCSGSPAAVGELGDVVIRSRRLADGYADPVLTDRYFGTVPGGDQADRFFRTGDLGRYRPDGSVVLAGRADSQVKVRGFRVEVGEISALLAGHPEVRQAYVAVRGPAHDQRLHAYIVPAGPGLSAARLLGQLRSELPGYAVPADLTLLPALPVTPNGKVDVAALPRASGRPAQPAQELIRPAERAIAGVWRAVLGVPRLGASDNFFDIGGDSLAIVAVHARLTEKFSAPLSVADLFRYPTIRSLADFIEGGSRDASLVRATQRAAQRRDRMSRRAARQSIRGDRS